MKKPQFIRVLNHRDLTPCDSGRDGVVAILTRKSLTQSGFTLLELLVVMSLLSVVMLAMGSALRSAAQIESRIDERLQRIDQMRVVNKFLRQILGRIDLVKSSNPSDRRVLFAADANSVSWLGIMPARHGAGGRYFFRLATEQTTQGRALVLRYAPWVLQTEFPEWTQSESHILVSNVIDFKVEAEGLPLDIQLTPTDWPRGWQVGWSVSDTAPQRIRLTWLDNKVEWPPLVITLVPTIQSLPSSGGFVSGGSIR